MSRELLGVAGGVIVAAAGVYYIVDVLRGRSRPHVGSWLVWSVIGVLGFGTADQAGAGAGGLAAGVYVCTYIATLLVSLNPRFGKPGVERWDWPVCGIAIAGIVLWRLGPLSNDAGATLAVACDALGLWPTQREAWREPHQESPGAWSADAAGNLLCVAALASSSYAAIVYPVYLLAATGSVAGVVLYRRRRLAARDVVTELVGATSSPTPS